MQAALWCHLLCTAIKSLIIILHLLHKTSIWKSAVSRSKSLCLCQKQVKNYPSLGKINILDTPDIFCNFPISFPWNTGWSDKESYKCLRWALGREEGINAGGAGSDWQDLLILHPRDHLSLCLMPRSGASLDSRAPINNDGIILEISAVSLSEHSELSWGLDVVPFQAQGTF